MLLRTLSFAAVAVCAAAPVAHGQSMLPDYQWTNDSSGNDDFGRCAQYDAHNPQRALDACGRLIAARESSAVTGGGYYFRGLLYAQMHNAEASRSDFEHAYTYFTIALRSNRRDPDSYSNRAAVLALLERYPEALADYETAIRMADRTDSGAGTRVRSGVAERRAGQIAGLQQDRGEVLFQMRNWAGAIEAFDAAAALEPLDAEHQAARCEARAAANTDIDAARVACEEALRASGGGTYALVSRGFLNFTQGDVAGALADFSAAYDLDETNYDALYARGVARVRLGQHEGEADIASAVAEARPDAIAYYANAGLR